MCRMKRRSSCIARRSERGSADERSSARGSGWSSIWTSGCSLLPLCLLSVCFLLCVFAFLQCEDIYHTRSTRHEQIDGAYFGTTFPHLFFLTFPELKPLKSNETYIPRVFGFKIHHTAYKASLETRKKQTEAAAAAAAANGGAGGSQSAEQKLLQPQQPPVGENEKDKLKSRR